MHAEHNDDTIKTSRHSSLEKYTSHFIERVVCERESETEQRLLHIEPLNLLAFTTLFPNLLGCSTGGLGAQPLRGHGSHSSILSPTDLNFLSPGLYNNLTITYFLRASQFALNSTVKVAHWYLRPVAPVIYTGAFLLLTAWLGSVCNNAISMDFPDSLSLFVSIIHCFRQVF